MKHIRPILSVVILSGSVGLGGQLLFAQSAPREGPMGPSDPRQQPPIPGQPAPGLPQREPFPGQPGPLPQRDPRSDPENQVISADDIMRAQKALRAKGHNPGKLSGRMDPETQEALRDFQKDNNLPATGVLDQKTAEKLGVSTGESSAPQREGGKATSRPEGSGR
jgi:hypothetical protein